MEPAHRVKKKKRGKKWPSYVTRRRFAPNFHIIVFVLWHRSDGPVELIGIEFNYTKNLRQNYAVTARCAPERIGTETWEAETPAPSPPLAKPGDAIHRAAASTSFPHPRTCHRLSSPSPRPGLNQPQTTAWGKE